ncbi:MAG: T9SS type A sorting domain-containing protein, partial [Saprospiraceae bacterium]|nr:T9SS type A sorting domain-containing protein [Saprospiraceae bacterium]
ISDEDKQKLDELRVVFADRKEKMTKEKGEMRMQAHPRHKGKRGSAERGAQKKELDPNREAMKSLVEKYSEDIESLMEEITAEREQWKKDMKAIKEKAKPKMEGERGERRRGHFRNGRHEKGMKERGMKRKSMDKEDHEEKVRGKKAAHFLLMDPKADPSELSPRSTAVRSLNIYPNPVAGQLNISFEPAEETNVAIELRNEAGQLIKELQPLETVSREVKWTYDVNNIPDGVYIVVLKGKDKILQSKTIVISK